jgi:hypothetical protein
MPCYKKEDRNTRTMEKQILGYPITRQFRKSSVYVENSMPRMVEAGSAARVKRIMKMSVDTYY